MKRLLLPLVLAATLLVPAAAAQPDAGTRFWTVTIRNLTGGQPLSPPSFAVHSSKVDVWSVGAIANHGVAAIAEDANNAPLESALARLDGVDRAWTGLGGPIPPGASRTYTFRTRGNADRLTVLTMLVNTNDAFTGLDARHVRGRGASAATMAYDAGSERNNERAAFIPGPCCGNPFVRDPEGALIAAHPGVAGGADLDPAVHGWSGPVARISIVPS